jgi:tRNA nucleotidyltransferase/poly(A) polymerase
MSYPGHENVSAEIAEEVLRRLGFGNERFLVEKIVKEHMRPHGEMETPKSIGKFLREFDSLKMQDDRKSKLWRLTWLHSIADSMSKGAVDYHEDIKHKQDVMKTIEDFINNQASMGKKPLLDGKEIMQMFPDINPKTGFIKIMQEALLQAQDEGKVVDKNSAEKFLKDNKNNLMTI